MPEPKPPRRKLRIRWILAALVLLFFVWFCYQLFGPNPAIVVSKETTFITEPLGPDGLPDYEAYLLQQGSKGVTPENNAAVLIWQAMWPGELEQQHWLLLCDALGMDKVPSAKDGLVDPYDQVVRAKIALEFTQRISENASDQDKTHYSGKEYQDRLRNVTAQNLIEEAMVRPWTSKEIPSLGEWVEQNQKPLDLLIEASKRPRFYSPSPSVLNSSYDNFIAMLVPEMFTIRTAARGLKLRAMWHLGEGRSDLAWRDLLACHHLARSASKSNLLVGQLIAIATNGISCQGTHLLSHHANLDTELAQKILVELNQMGNASSCQRAIDQGERLSYPDIVMGLATGKLDTASLAAMEIGSEKLTSFLRLRTDWNQILRFGNRWCDDLVAAAKLPTFGQRRKEFDRIEEKLYQLLSQHDSTKNWWLSGVFSSKYRNEVVGNLLVYQILSTLTVAFKAEDRAYTQLELTRLAAALAVYRAEQGAYPEQLADLVPSVLSKLPVDLYSGKSFLYERKNDGGYLLYSVFENEIDDLGNDMSGEIVEGEWVEEVPDYFDYEETDLVIRVPVPAFEFPELPSKEDFGYGYGGGYGSEAEDGYGE